MLGPMGPVFCVKHCLFFCVCFHVFLSVCPVCKQNHPLRYNNSQADVSWADKFTVPSLEADQRIHNTSLMVFSHVLMHIRVVLPDVALGAAVGNRPEAKRRRIGVWTLELQGEKEGEQNRDRLFKEGTDGRRQGQPKRKEMGKQRG